MGHLQKERLRPNLETPKTILDRKSAYKLRTKTTELPKLRAFKVRAPTLTILHKIIFFQVPQKELRHCKLEQKIVFSKKQKYVEIGVLQLT